MFDIGFSELLVIGGIALIVLGPEKLATLARTAGQIIGRSQRYIHSIKHNLTHENSVLELKLLKEQLESASRDLHYSLEKEVLDLKKQAMLNGTFHSSMLTSDSSLTESLYTNQPFNSNPILSESTVQVDLSQFNQTVLMNWYNELDQLKIEIQSTEQKIKYLKDEITHLTTKHKPVVSTNIDNPIAHG